MKFPRWKLILVDGGMAACFVGLLLAALFTSEMLAGVMFVLFVAVALWGVISVMRCPNCGEGFPRGIHPWTGSFYCPKCGTHLTIEDSPKKK